VRLGDRVLRTPPRASTATLPARRIALLMQEALLFTWT
jgi:hypothetical protein